MAYPKVGRTALMVVFQEDGVNIESADDVIRIFKPI